MTDVIDKYIRWEDRKRRRPGVRPLGVRRLPAGEGDDGVASLRVGDEAACQQPQALAQALLAPGSKLGPTCFARSLVYPSLDPRAWAGVGHRAWLGLRQQGSACPRRSWSGLTYAGLCKREEVRDWMRVAVAAACVCLPVPVDACCWGRGVTGQGRINTVDTGCGMSMSCGCGNTGHRTGCV